MLKPLRFLLAPRPQTSAFSAPHLIDGLIQVLSDVKTVQHMQCLPGLGG